MKINVGDYVRTKTGIHKVFEINEKATVWKCLCDKKPTGEWDGSYEYTTIKEENIIKSAEGTPRGLLNLIEVGDYVNGFRVSDIYKDINEQVRMKFGNNNLVLASKSNYDNYYLFEDDIKSIVTKEQFESMQYVIKED